MEELNLLHELGRVNAPPDFEQRVMARLAQRKRKKARVRRFSLSLAGAVSAAAVILIVLNVFILTDRGAEDYLGQKKAVPAGFWGPQTESDFIPIIEPVDYAGEIRSLRSDPPTIYILEQVSDYTDTKIKY